MSYLSYCGLLCNECPLYIATKDNDMAAKQRLARECSTGDVTFTADDMTCAGCGQAQADNSKMCGDCEIRACARLKAVESCGHCRAYPCAIVDRRLPSDSDGRRRLNSIAGR